MAFANENILSGHGPQIPTAISPQNGAPVINVTLVDPASPDTILNCIEKLSEFDDTSYQYWSGAGGEVVAVCRELWTSDDFTFQVNCEEVNADEGTFTYRIPQTATVTPGVFVVEVALLNHSDIVVVANAGYLEVQMSLLSQQDRLVVSVPTIRRMMRDAHPRANRILEECEFTLAEIQDAIFETVEEWNTTPPVMSGVFHTSQTFPWPYRLARGVVGRLLETAAIWYLRNDLRIRTPGLDVNDMEKGPAYDKLGKTYRAEWLDWTKRIKRQINVAGGWGRVASGSYR